MGRKNIAETLERLDTVLALLKATETHTVQDLADQLNVSSRTILRDLNRLRDKGYPIESEQGRGGGVRLAPRWGIGRLTLNYRETIDLILGLNILEQLQSPLFLHHLQNVRHKVLASFPDSQRENIRQIRQRLLIGPLANPHILDTYNRPQFPERHDVILNSFFHQTRLTIHYERADETLTTRDIEIHFLHLNWPIWYLVAYDHLRQAPRTFRIDRIKECVASETSFALKPLSDFPKDLRDFARTL